MNSYKHIFFCQNPLVGILINILSCQNPLVGILKNKPLSEWSGSSQGTGNHIDWCSNVNQIKVLLIYTSIITKFKQTFYEFIIIKFASKPCKLCHVIDIHNKIICLIICFILQLFSTSRLWSFIVVGQCHLIWETGSVTALVNYVWYH